jgi:hypothetical protein
MTCRHDGILLAAAIPRGAGADAPCGRGGCGVDLETVLIDRQAAWRFISG